MISYSDCHGCGRDDPGHRFDRPGDEGFYSSIDWAAVMPVLEAECPILQQFRQQVRQVGFAAFKISDFFSRRELYRTPTFKFLLEPYGLKDNLELLLPIAPPGGSSASTAAAAISAHATAPSSRL